MDPKAALEEARRLVGGGAALARKISELIKPDKITAQAISQWDRVPPNRVLLVEQITDGKVTRYQLRPDIYGAEPPADAAPASEAAA